MLGTRRRLFEPVKQRLGAALSRLGLPAWVFTLLGVPLALTSAGLYYHGQSGRAALVGCLAALADFVDGAVARRQNSQSPLGDYLDAIADRVVELSLLLALAVDFAPVVCWAIAASMLVSYCKPRVALAIPADDHDWPGVGDHADRLVLILLAMALAALSKPAARWTLMGLSAVCAVGALQRVIYGCGLIRKSHQAVDLTAQLDITAPG